MANEATIHVLPSDDKSAYPSLQCTLVATSYQWNHSACLLSHNEMGKHRNRGRTWQERNDLKMGTLLPCGKHFPFESLLIWPTCFILIQPTGDLFGSFSMY